MSAEPPAASRPDSEDPIGARYPNTARIWNYQLGGKDNFVVDREASEAANAMVRALGVPDGADSAVESRHLLPSTIAGSAGTCAGSASRTGPKQSLPAAARQVPPLGGWYPLATNQRLRAHLRGMLQAGSG